MNTVTEMPPIIQTESIADAGRELGAAISGRGVHRTQLFAVCDRKMASLLQQLGISSPTYLLDADEGGKSFETAIDICRWLISHEADRSAFLLNIGGGITSDIAGFAASIYKRGIRFANIPTTLLSQVDAAIGGKNGANLDGLKNMVGTFRQPEFVILCTEFLKTLPANEFLSGAAEMLKTFLIASEEDYHEAIELISAINRGNSGAGRQSPAIMTDAQMSRLGGFIRRAAEIKNSIIAEDPYDNGRRRILNLGHTCAHAIEWWQSRHGSSHFTHGEAVAIGIIHTVRISGNSSLAERLADDFVKCGLPTELPCPEAELEIAISQDKKREDGHLHRILLPAIAQAAIE